MNSKAYELQLTSEENNLTELLSFVKERLAEAGYSLKMQRQIATAAEEVFVNIAHYAYEPEIGPVCVGMELTDMPDAVTLTFADTGMPFNPLEKQDPDVSLPGEEREIGGLGIFMTKMIMDEMTYEYSKGQNILSMRKCFGEGD